MRINKKTSHHCRKRGFRGFLLVLFLGGVGFSGLSSRGEAAVRTWDGSDGLLASDANNWTPAIVPVAGDEVIFDGVTSSTDCTFDLTGVDVSTVALTNGYTGTVTLTQNLVITHMLFLDSGTFNAGNSVVELDRDMSVNSASATFNAGSSTFSLTGGGAQTIHPSGVNFHFINNFNTGPGVRFVSSFSAVAFISTQPGSDVLFQNGETFTFNTFIVMGSSTDTVMIDSLTQASPVWNLIVTGTATVDYADVGRSDASSSSVLPIDATNSNNVGGNSGWNFIGGGGGAIAGNVTNNSLQVGDIWVVAKTTDTGSIVSSTQVATGNVNSNVFAYAVGSLPLGTSYFIKAFVDKNFNGFPDFDEDNGLSSEVGVPTTNTVTGVDVTISSNAAAVLGMDPNHIEIKDQYGQWFQTIVAGNRSSELRVFLVDLFGTPSATSTALTIDFTAFDFNGNSISPGDFSISTDNFTTTFSQLILASTTVKTDKFRFLTSLATNLTLVATVNNFPQAGDVRQAFYDLFVLPSGTAFSDVGVRSISDAPNTVRTSLTITPNNDGNDDGAVFSCSPPGNGDWELLISNNGNFEDDDIIARFFAFGNDSISWFGQNDFDGRPVPNGTYLVRFQTPGGGITDDSVTVTVDSAFIQGRVLSSGNPQSDVAVDVFGPGGGGFALTDDNGNFFVGGLTAGNVYGVEFNRQGLAGRKILGVAANTDMGDVSLDAGSTIRVHAEVDQSPGREVWGGVFVYNSDFSNTAWGNVHIPATSTGSDNGFPAFDPNYSTWTSIGLLPSTDYTVELNIPEYGVFTQTLQSPASGGSTDLVFTSIQRKANIYGWAILPAAPQTPYGGEWVAVDAFKDGATEPTAFGGAWIDSSRSSQVYSVAGLDPGVYTLRAYVRGFQSQTLSGITVTGTTDVGDAVNGGADFAVFGEGGKIEGTITVTGDSTNIDGSNSHDISFSTNSGNFPVFVNAWSPTTFSGAFQEVYLANDASVTSSTYALTGLEDGTYEVFSFLPGFQLVPPGPQQITVTNGVGSLNINFEANTGSIDLTVALPSGDDPTNVEYSVAQNGPQDDSNSGFLTGATMSIGQLGTGLYRLSLTNKNSGRGLRKEVPVSVINGAATAVTVNMDEQTYTLGGTVDLQGNITLPSPWNVTVSSMAGLRVAATAIDTQNQAPIVQVFGFPLPESFFGEVPPLRSIPATLSGSDATFSIPGFLPGTYLVRVSEDLDPPTDFSMGPPADAQPEFATNNLVVTIRDDHITDLALVVSNGVELSGTISRPTGDSSTDGREFKVELRREDNLAVFATTVTTSGQGTASYTLRHLAEGQYILQVFENSETPKYTAIPKRVTVAKSNLTKNVTLVLAGTIVGKLRDGDSNTLISDRNVNQFLPPEFEIFAEANPWTAGGFSQAAKDHSQQGPGVIKFSSATSQFTVYRLIPDASYDVNFRGFRGFGDLAISKGQKSYAPVVKSGVRVAAGQTVDIGTIDLNQGVTLSGTVTDSAGNVLPNILVQAEPSLTNGEDAENFLVEAMTDAQGKYTLQGVDRAQRFYDVIASPRFELGDVLRELGGQKYAEEERIMIDVSDPSLRSGIDFSLEAANGVLSGSVTTVDGGALASPFGESESLTDGRAMVFLAEEGKILGEDPLGNIQEFTDPLGNFRIDALKPGTYVMRIVSLGYVTGKETVIVVEGENNAGTITLQKGASVSGSITKPDGSNPSISEVEEILGVDEDFEEFIFGKVESNATTNLVTGYSLTGFKTGLNYAIVILTENDDVLEAKSGLSFTSTDQEESIDLVYRPAPPAVFATQSRSGNTYTLRFFSTHKVRNLTDADNDLTTLMALVTGNGSVTSRDLSSSRDFMTVVYDAAAAEKTFTIRIAFTSIQVDPDSETGENFTFSQDFQFFAGVGRSRVVRIPNATGGNAILEGDPTGMGFVSGNFDVDRSSRVEVGVRSAADLDTVTGAAPARGPVARAQVAFGVARNLGALAYPHEALYGAVSQAPSVSPFSAFYDIFLPAGVSRSFQKEALLTLQYDSSVTDPSSLNVYYFDENNNVFLLEDYKRKIDTENKTITVAVNHASVYVVLNNSAQIVGANSYTGTEILIHNFPNPFNLKSKTVTLTQVDPTVTANQTITGTMIRYALPSNKTGTVKFEIYNVVGELVRTLTETASTGGSYYYTEWDGRNGSGQKIASGVYIVRFTLNGGDEKFLKLAVIK